jgi:sugar/nucleoside kinase (ribokinase family)
MRSYPNVDVSGIYKFNGPTNSVHLYYNADQKRSECSEHIAEPIPWKKIKPSLDTDMILINMISGFDVTLETLDMIRMEVREAHVPIYFDVHSLTLGLNEDFTRDHRPVSEWRRWLFMIHAVQLNEEESQILTPDTLDEQNLAHQVLTLYTKALIVTRGKNGCTVFIDEHKRTKRFDVDGISAGDRIDPTGCGDVFGAAYCARFLYSKNIAASVEFANRVAAFNAQSPGSAGIDMLSSFRLEESITEGQRS